MLRAAAATTRLALFVAMVLCLPYESLGKDPPKDNGAKDPQIEKLIDRLALAGVRSSHGKREEVFAAADELLKLGTKAFPQLIAHYDDKRISFDEDQPDGPRTFHEPVGEYCVRIIERQVNKWKGWNVRDPRGTPTYGRSIVPLDKKAALAWWDKNKAKSLWQLQADSVRWAIEENKNPKNFKPGDIERRKLADDAIVANEALVKQLTDTKTPLPTEPIRPYKDR